MHYMAAAPEFSKHERFAYLFDDTSLQTVITRACLDLVTTLGLLTLTDRFDPKRVDLESPSVWQARELRTRIVHNDHQTKGFSLRVEIIPNGDINRHISQTPSRQELVIGFDIFTYGWVPAWVRCDRCSKLLNEEGYSASHLDELRQLSPESGVGVIASCVPCARQRARGMTGTATIDGTQHRLRIDSWSPVQPDELEVRPVDVAFDGPGQSGPMAMRISVADFTPDPEK